MLDEALQQKVVDGRHLIVLVPIETGRGVVLLEPIPLEVAQQRGFYRNLIFAHNQSLVGAHRLVLLVPVMLLDLLGSQSLVWVRLHDLVEQVLARFRYPLWHLELPTEDLLVELVRVFVFEWQVSSNHGEQDHTTGPYIDA